MSKFKKVTLYKATWGDGYTPEQKFVTLDFFSEDVGYTLEDIANIANLKAGEKWVSSDPAEHYVKSFGEQIIIIDNRDELNQEIVLTYGHYGNGNLYIGSVTFDEEFEPWMDITVNMGTVPELGLVEIKNYSENEGVAQLMLDAGIVTRAYDERFTLFYLSKEVSQIAYKTIELQKQDEAEEIARQVSKSVPDTEPESAAEANVLENGSDDQDIVEILKEFIHDLENHAEMPSKLHAYGFRSYEKIQAFIAKAESGKNVSHQD